MSTTPASDTEAGRDITRAWLFVGGTFVALILNGLWTIFVGTASPGGDESELVQGWTGVLRNLPAYLLLVSVASVSVWYATRAGSRGSHRGKLALIVTSLVLLFALNSVTRDAAEVVMTTRAATVAWAMFGVDLVVVALVYVAARTRIARAGA